MVHYAVESILQKRGFLRRLRDGESAGFQMTADAKSDDVARLVEVMQGDAWAGGDTSLEEMRALYATTCQARRSAMLPISGEEIGAIHDIIRQLDAAWQRLPVGQSWRVVI